ncbi:SPOR domain-containing protein, partial [Novacetimonas pomaceti]
GRGIGATLSGLLGSGLLGGNDPMTRRLLYGAAAQKSWGRLQRQYASLFGDRQPAIVRAERNGTTFYRLRVKGFATTAEASAFCQQVKAHGLACNPVRF